MRSQTSQGSVERANPDAARLERQVRQRLYGRLSEFQVLMRERGVILRGRSRTFYEKQLAQHALMQITRLPILANEIEVD
jgi:hypothetical protein